MLEDYFERLFVLVVVCQVVVLRRLFSLLLVEDGRFFDVQVPRDWFVDFCHFVRLSWAMEFGNLVGNALDHRPVDYSYLKSLQDDTFQALVVSVECKSFLLVSFVVVDR